METIYTIGTNPEYWGTGVSKAQAEACAEHVRKHLVAYAEAQGYEVEVHIVWDTTAWGDQSHGDEDIIADLDGYSQEHWISWLDDMPEEDAEMEG